uniref:small monomeric GTPase n=1 Tax=Oryctolagus cuniculus TaxID=9986 RepID=G1TMK2_RABIT|nr:ras-related protein Rab-3C isoform X3 [Oryctolagus cuniculus]
MRHEAPMQMASTQDARYGQKDSSDQNFDYMFKLLIIGNSSVGKTSFLFRYADDSFTSAFVSTVGIDFKVKTVFKNEKRIKLQIWDTAGQERYRTITTAYYRGAMGFILMYDITNEESFNAVQDWSTQIKTYSWDNAQVILVGNKCDMEDERVISTERGQRLGEQLGPLMLWWPKQPDTRREQVTFSGGVPGVDPSKGKFHTAMSRPRKTPKMNSAGYKGQP